LVKLKLTYFRMDLEMPGPVRRRGKHLHAALKEGHIKESSIDRCASRVLQLLHKTGKYKLPDWQESIEQAWDLSEHRKILRNAGVDGNFTCSPS
jgi:beta-glucosidase